ncbi:MULTISPECIES: hypothetical protein [Streptomyces]|uniref:DUF3558 domain-containing protein n=2 Tax=Streptomyces TaxID=1883 RepID=A0A124EBU8_9ACTN|nr:MULTISPECIES: hypothetical protein [Streptomyces]KUH35617.1 hypothetical protein ATE80_28250 [Streptomyces kanasensis]UUS32379.1 DUF3558 domain-containing protein [Streptomyces changanensis]
MQRRAYATGLAALLAALSATTLAGCDSGSGSDGSDVDAKAGTTAGTVVQPGRYRTLYEPCGAVSRGTLQNMLPAVTTLTPEQRERVLRGTAAVTYDTDRRAGCAWKAEGPDAIHHLTLDFERVVSFDPSVSDETRAQEVYTTKESAAGLAPATPAPPTAGATGTTGTTGTAAPSATSSSSPGARGTARTAGSALSPAGAPAAPGTAAPGTAAAGQAPQTVSPAAPVPGGAPSVPASSSAPASSAPPEGLASRVLADLGDAAFLHDVLAPAGPAAQQRTISVVFRTSNVVVTVRYAAQPMRVGEVPDSEELQEKARDLARRLAERFDE